MAKSIEFGSREEANEIRSKIDEYRAESDDRRKKTVKIESDAPDRIVDRLESESFASVEQNNSSAGMAELTPREKQTLARSSDFQWQEHGFAAMRAKAALQAKGATEWTDFYNPGEGKAGALKNLRQSKQQGAATGASIGVGGDRTDEEEISGRRRRRRQVERGQAADVGRAKPAALGGDMEAIGFLRDEQRFDDVFDINFRTTGGPSGRDFESVQEAHRDRSKQAQRLDERRSADVTRDPLVWAEAKDRYDFPGVDTVEPERLHEQRTSMAQRVDEARAAPLADSREEWAMSPGVFDWPGVDTPSEGGIDFVGGRVSSNDPTDSMSAEVSETFEQNGLDSVIGFGEFEERVFDQQEQMGVSTDDAAEMVVNAVSNRRDPMSDGFQADPLGDMNSNVGDTLDSLDQTTGGRY